MIAALTTIVIGHLFVRELRRLRRHQRWAARIREELRDEVLILEVGRYFASQ